MSWPQKIKDEAGVKLVVGNAFRYIKALPHAHLFATSSTVSSSTRCSNKGRLLIIIHLTTSCLHPLAELQSVSCKFEAPLLCCDMRSDYNRRKSAQEILSLLLPPGVPFVPYFLL